MSRIASSPTMRGTVAAENLRKSRWGKEDVVRTDKDGFTVLDSGVLESIADE
jgi:hypothetical protein